MHVCMILSVNASGAFGLLRNIPATPGRVREVAVPPAARRLSTLPHVDYEDAFLIEIGAAQDRTPEQWARAILEDAPITIRTALRSGWLALGLQLDPSPSERSVLGWEVWRSTPEYVLLAGSSRIGLSAELLFKRQRAHAAFRDPPATGEPHRPRSLGRSRARASTHRAVPPRAGQPPVTERAIERPADRRRITRHPRRRHPRRGRRGPRGEEAFAGDAAVQSLRWSEDDQDHDPRHVAHDHHRLSHPRIRASPVRLGRRRRCSPGNRPGRRRRVHRLRGACGGTGGRVFAIPFIPVPPPRLRPC